MAGFARGDRVHVAGLGTGVVREVRNGGRFLIELKGRSIVVAAADLKPAQPARRASVARSTQHVAREEHAARSTQHLAREEHAAREHVARGHVARSTQHVARVLDLHGMTTADAIEALDAFLNDALLAGAGEARVIHGRSGGKLKAAVHARLRQLPSIRGFRVDPRNAGVTIVQL
jgi:DNA-nicking Smr family endonuclease